MREITIREALREAIDEELGRDENVFILGEEVAEYNGAYKVTKGLLDKYGPKRVIDTPIIEGGFSGLAVGAALTGLRPIVEFMSFNFSFVAFDQIVNNAMKMHYMSGGRFTVPIVFRGPNGAAARVSCQHSHNVEPLYGHLPGCKIVAPSTAYDSKGLLKAAIRDNNPVFVLENEMIYNMKGEVPEGDYTVEIGKAKIVREGKHLTLLSYSRMLYFCEEVVEEFEKRGISIELIDLRTIKPLDVGTIVSSVKKTHRAVVVEEGHKFAGVGAEVTSIIQEFCFDSLDAPVERVCQMETPLPYSPPLEEETIPNPKRIKAAIEKTLKGVI
ncbi:pyruvate dehydrogenase complex E1 component subunit beta [bacterium]|nr:pyruvate dehydrogenase complex E1 component subunit beta [bacterium]